MRAEPDPLRPEPDPLRPEPDPLRAEPVEGQSRQPFGGEPLRPTGLALHGRWRLLRVAALGGSSMLLATGAHLVGGGRLPAVGLLVVMTFLIGLTAVTVTARRVRFGTLIALLGIEQLLMHELFGAAALTSAGCTPALGSHTAAMARCAVGAHGSAAGSSMNGAGFGMLLAHLAATLATAWLLARGEQWLWRLCDRVVRSATCAPTPRTRRAPAPRPLPRPLLSLGFRRTPAEPRGPPVACVRLDPASA